MVIEVPRLGLARSTALMLGTQAMVLGMQALVLGPMLMVFLVLMAWMQQTAVWLVAGDAG